MPLWSDQAAMSTFAESARQAFGFLEDLGFRFRADDSNLPRYADAYFEKAGIRVRVYWEQRDGVVVTYVGRRRAFGLLSPRELGLGFLDDLDHAQQGDQIHELEDERLRAELARQAEVLRSRGEGLLKGDPAAWNDLARRQRLYWKDFRRQ
ncbi:MAG: hypothetical protein A2Z32_04855 [Chloroflexi bacterium RBG_16_69_14]|nr:MAG: hypothetical protein A2Z32_04855 [Chloroflexi bacterium RBG_16_69_14]